VLGDWGEGFATSLLLAPCEVDLALALSFSLVRVVGACSVEEVGSSGSRAAGDLPPWAALDLAPGV